MADVRALLKAKREEARIAHPLASYSQSGQLKCVACGPVKHAAAWQGHLGSKLHRTTVARLKEQERERAAQQMGNKGGDEVQQGYAPTGKRKAEGNDSDSDSDAKRRKVDNASSAFPADFFSDPSRAPLPPPSDDEDDPPAGQPDPASASVPATSLDSEWERFQRDVVNVSDHRDTYENATIMAEPVLASETPEGFPPQQTEDAPEEPNKLKLEEARRQKEQDERELIMDRLLDEERAQEEADMKVTIMKNRLDALRRKREAAKAARHVHV
ncbi:hypothetical protein B0H15DRAFT_766979 [Mycena belliarum]|uniref:Coiled-coil domain-containing protein 16 n=1 Tax=Mycena belliarum TaxID=1033014 RepID=A0AAD6XWQ7_9AGAR|nr:hypothetical protein B0H15DRAFT_766979 [Mycena belliae]